MNNMKKFRMAVFAIAVLFISTALFSQPLNTYTMRVLSGSRIWVEGDSSLHKYKSTNSVVKMDNQIVFKAMPAMSDGPVQALVTNKSFSPTLRRFVLNIAVKNFHSKIMGFDSQFRKTLKSSEHPNITFTVSNYTVKADKNNDNQFIINTNGVVRIAGQEKEISVTSIAKLGEESATISGKTDLLMTDFMIDPPKLLFVTTDNKVTVRWNLILALEPQEHTLISEK